MHPLTKDRLIRFGIPSITFIVAAAVAVYILLHVAGCGATYVEATHATFDTTQAITDLQAAQAMQAGAAKDAAVAKAVKEAQDAIAESAKVKAEADNSAKWLNWAELGLGVLTVVAGMTGTGAIVAKVGQNAAEAESAVQTTVSTAMGNGIEHLKAVLKAAAPEAYGPAMANVRNIQVAAGVKDRVVDLLHSVPTVSETAPEIQAIAGLVTVAAPVDSEVAKVAGQINQIVRAVSAQNAAPIADGLPLPKVGG